MAVHFKFKSAKDYDSISIEGHFVSLALLKEKIVEAKNLGKGADFDLVITNAQTEEEYTDDSFLVAKNTSVIVRRVPATTRRPAIQVIKKDTPVAATVPEPPRPDPKKVFDSNVEVDGLDEFGGDVLLPEAQSTLDMDENSRLQAMVNSTASDWQRQTAQAYSGRGGRGRGSFGRGGAGRGSFPPRNSGPPPPGYVCHRCGQPGHFIQNCPTNGDPEYDRRKKVKQPVGIPRSMLQSSADGSYILPTGEQAVMLPNEEDFAKEAGALPLSKSVVVEANSDMRCPLCNDVLKDAVLIPCCSTSFCDHCIRDELMTKGTCPGCGATNIINDNLLPNLTLRRMIDAFRTSQGGIPAATATTANSGEMSGKQGTAKSPSPLQTRSEERSAVKVASTTSTPPQAARSQPLQTNPERATTPPQAARSEPLQPKQESVVQDNPPQMHAPRQDAAEPVLEEAKVAPSSFSAPEVSTRSVVRPQSRLSGGSRPPAGPASSGQPDQLAREPPENPRKRGPPAGAFGFEGGPDGPMPPFGGPMGEAWAPPGPYGMGWAPNGLAMPFDGPMMRPVGPGGPYDFRAPFMNGAVPGPGFLDGPSPMDIPPLSREEFTKLREEARRKWKARKASRERSPSRERDSLSEEAEDVRDEERGQLERRRKSPVDEPSHSRMSRREQPHEQGRPSSRQLDSRRPASSRERSHRHENAYAHKEKLGSDGEANSTGDSKRRRHSREESERGASKKVERSAKTLEDRERDSFLDTSEAYGRSGREHAKRKHEKSGQDVNGVFARLGHKHGGKEEIYEESGRHASPKKSTKHIQDNSSGRWAPQDEVRYSERRPDELPQGDDAGTSKGKKEHSKRKKHRRREDEVLEEEVEPEDGPKQRKSKSKRHKSKGEAEQDMEGDERWGLADEQLQASRHHRRHS